MRLVLDERIGQGQFLHRGGGNPLAGLRHRAQGVVHTFVEMLSHQVVGGLAVEQDNRVVVAEEARRRDRAWRDVVGAMEPQDLLNEVDRPVEVAPPAGNRHGPLRLPVGSLLLAHDVKLERLQRRLHLLIGDVETNLAANEFRREADLALPWALLAHLADRPDHLPAGRLKNQVDGAVGILQQRVRVDAPLVPVRTVRGEAQFPRCPAD